MSDFNIEHFGKRLAACRDAMGMKQAEFSNLLGCTNGAYSLYERGKRQPSLEILSSLCEDFGLSLDFLLSCMAPFPSTFCERLNSAISSHPDKPIEDLLQAIGVDSRSAKIFTSGAGFPNAKVLRRLSSYYSCSVDYLIGLSDTLAAPSSTPVSIQIAAVPRDPFDDLTDDQRVTIEAALSAFRAANAAKAQEA